ncbi:MAG: FAD-binding protein, partial [Deltaproteobacteria bacterium]|nr:FAD-binding protein [Deltaproteobacteria bacterium]
PVGRVGVWLDSPMIDLIHGEGTVRKELPAKFIQFQRYGIDISKVPMLIYPTLHYQNGGVKINGKGETSVKGLFAAGELTGGVHGRNRLMGNSLLDVLVFGRRAGEGAAIYATNGNGKGSKAKMSLKHVVEFEKILKDADIKKPSVGPILLPDYTPDHVREKRWE